MVLRGGGGPLSLFVLRRLISGLGGVGGGDWRTGGGSFGGVLFLTGWDLGRAGDDLPAATESLVKADEADGDLALSGDGLGLGVEFAALGVEHIEEAAGAIFVEVGGEGEGGAGLCFGFAQGGQGILGFGVAHEGGFHFFEREQHGLFISGASLMECGFGGFDILFQRPAGEEGDGHAGAERPEAGFAFDEVADFLTLPAGLGGEGEGWQPGGAGLSDLSGGGGDQSFGAADVGTAGEQAGGQAGGNLPRAGRPGGGGGQ